MMNKQSKPKEWSKYLWPMLFRYTFRFPANPTPSQKQDAETLFTIDIYRHVECDECSTHWREAMSKYPPDTRSGYALSYWLWQRRHDIDLRTHHPQPPTWPETVRQYTTAEEQQQEQHTRAIQKRDTPQSQLQQLFFTAGDDAFQNQVTFVSFFGIVLLLWLARASGHLRFL